MNATARTCKHGHPWAATEENPRGNVRYSRRPDGERRGRECAACQRAKQRRYRARKRAKARAYAALTSALEASA